jgi:hypothetical protein
MAVSTRTFGGKGGILSKVLNINAKTGPEKRIIKVQASLPFKPPGRPSSFLFDSIYESEVFEDQHELAASLLAEVKCPMDMDSKIRVNVYYNSSLSNQKDILICSTTFSLRDLRREESGILMLDFHSEHIENATGYAEIIAPLPQVLNDESVQLKAPVAEMNPLFQKYVFYREEDKTEIACECEEFCWEPRLAFRTSSSFVESVLTAILESKQGWIERRRLEEMRQGIFKSDQHANENGWHKLRVSVSGAYIKLRPSMTAAHHDLVPHQQNPAATLYVSYYPLFDQDESFQSSHRNERQSMKVLSHLAEESVNSVRNGKGLTAVGAFDAFSRTQKKKVDETLPSSYVEIYYENPEELFSTFVGRTNTEYHTLHPAYGSFLHDEFCKKADGNTSMALEPATYSKRDKAYTFVVFESINKGTNPLTLVDKLTATDGKLFDDFMRATCLGGGLPPSSADANLSRKVFGENGEDDPNADKVSQMVLSGSVPHFDRYVPNQDAQVRFDLYFEEYGGCKNVKVGTTSLRLGDITNKKSIWLKLKEVPIPQIHSSTPIIDSMEVLVSAEMTLSGVSIKATSILPNFQKPPASGTVPPISPVVAPATMPYAFELNRCANGHRVFPSEVLAEKCTRMIDAQKLNPESIIPNYIESITKSNEWKWHVGLSGIDPLIYDPNRELSANGQTVAMIAKNTPAMKTSEDLWAEPKKKGRGGAKNVDPDDLDEPPATPSPATPTPTKEKKNFFGGGLKFISTKGESRQDSTADVGDGETRKPNFVEGAEHQNPFDWSTAAQAELECEGNLSSPRLKQNSDVEKITKDKSTSTDLGAESTLTPSSSQVPSQVPKSTEGATPAEPVLPPPPPKHGRPMSMPWGRAPSLEDGNGVKRSAVKSMGALSLGGLIKVDENEDVEDEQAQDSAKEEEETPLDQILGVDDLKLVSDNKLLPRIDYSYPIPWIDMMIDKLDKLYYEMYSNLNQARLWSVESGVQSFFRSSSLKKTAYLQHIPTNLHIQMMTVRDHSLNVVPGSVDEEKANKSAAEIVQIVDSVTCGCMSPHGLGHKKGGLSHIEGRLLKQEVALHDLKEHFRRAAEEAKLRLASDHPCLYTQSAEHELLLDVGKRALAYEEFCFDVCKRRLMSISQALSIVVQCVLLKLTLVIEDHIEKAIADKWLQLGFLCVFEGLLSVAGHERSMLEDTITALEAVSMYSIRILPTPSDACVSEHDNCTGSGSSKGYTGSTTYVDPKHADVTICGREIQVYLPEGAVAKMPETYKTKIKDGGAVMPLVAVLFTQGIDIQQSMATGSIFSTGSQEIANLQLHVNLRGLNKLHKYCCRAMPVNDFATVNEAEDGSADAIKRSSSNLDNIQPESFNTVQNVDVHPLLYNLCESIKTADATAKNVDMLVKVEEACLLLNGCRVTFCKSGKDRTGMAVSLDQSRQLGERFGCGESLHRTIRDVQLMRLYGTRLGICDKNIGRPVYSINKLQVQFLPLQYRPPASVCESMLKKDNS